MTYNLENWIKGFDPNINKVWAEIEENFGGRRVLPSQLVLLIRAAHAKKEAQRFIARFIEQEPGESVTAKAEDLSDGSFCTIYEISQRYFQSIPGKIVRDYLVFNGHKKKKLGRKILYAQSGLEELSFCFFDDTELVKETLKRNRYRNKDIGEFSLKKQIDLIQKKTHAEKTDEIKKTWLDKDDREVTS